MTSPCASRCPTCCREFGFRAEAFSSAEAFLESGSLNETGCLILDVTMPGMSGPELQRQLALSGQAIPIVYITAHGGDSLRPRLLAGGAVECLSKPFSDTALREALNSAFRTG